MLCNMGPAAKSSIRIINERGPSQNHCSIPPDKVVQVENSPGNRTLWRRLDRYEWSHFIRKWGPPFAKNLRTNRFWSTLLNALAKSTNTALMDLPASRVEHHWCSIETKAWLVDLPRRDSSDGLTVHTLACSAVVSTLVWMAGQQLWVTCHNVT